MGGFWILKDGEVTQVLDLLEWGKVFRPETRHIARTEIDDVLISTVFLGIDHQWGRGPPLLFETMVFGGELSGEQVRYSTLREAKAGHEKMVKRIEDAGKGVED